MTTTQERELNSLLDKAKDKDKAIEVALLLLVGITTKGDSFERELKEYLKTKDKDRLEQLLYGVDKV